MKRFLSLCVLFAALCAFVGAPGCSNKPQGADKDQAKSKEKDKTGGNVGASNTEADKLAKAIVGNWVKEGDDKTSYAFRESGDYSYRGGDLTLKGKWKALDAKDVELTFTLTKAELDLLKPIFEVTKKGIDALNDAAKKAADASGGLIKFEPIPAPPEPKEGENSWKETIVAKDSELLQISRVKYKKQIGTWGPFQQTGKFVAQIGGSGEIYFPLPYAETPVIELKRFAGPLDLKITERTSTGFKWQQTGKDKQFGNPEMTFIANGIPKEKDQTPFEQSGSFKATPGASGEEKFPQAYASPPHIELSVKVGLHKVMITKTTATGFTWRNEGTDKFFDNRDMNYVAKGLKAN